MDHARCRCQAGEARECPMHGGAAADPRIPWVLSDNDVRLLRRFGIDPEREPV